MASYKDMARDLAKKVEVLGGYIKDHAITTEKLSDQLIELSRDIGHFSDQVGELEKQKQD